MIELEKLRQLSTDELEDILAKEFDAHSDGVPDHELISEACDLLIDREDLTEEEQRRQTETAWLEFVKSVQGRTQKL